MNCSEPPVLTTLAMVSSATATSFLRSRDFLGSIIAADAGLAPTMQISANEVPSSILNASAAQRSSSWALNLMSLVLSSHDSIMQTMSQCMRKCLSPQLAQFQADQPFEHRSTAVSTCICHNQCEVSDRQMESSPPRRSEFCQTLRLPTALLDAC